MTQGARQRRRLRAAAMHQDDADADLVEDVDLLDDRQRGLCATFMERHGFRVLRFWNDQVLTDTDGVLEQILAALDEGAHR